MRFMIQQLSVWLAMWLGSTQIANAGTILLSGDINIGNPIDGSSGSTINAGNTRFFRNVLGSGTNVLIHNELIGTLSGQNATFAINNLYNSIGGVTSTLDTSGTGITSGLLLGIDVFYGMKPNNSYSLSELSVLSNFLAGAGKVFFVGENNTNFSASNAFINQALLGLGSSLRLGNDSIGAGFATSLNIDVDPFTAGILSFGYASTNSVTGGKSLIRTVDARTFIAYETIGASTVPEPSTFIIWATGSVSVSFFGARRRNRDPLANHRQHRESDG